MNKITQFIGWATPDGKQFFSKDEAIAHYIRTTMRDLFSALVAESQKDADPYDFDDYRLIDHLTDSVPAIVNRWEAVVAEFETPK